MTDEMANFQQVIFHDVKEMYPVGEDIPCIYVLSASVEPNDRDWIGFYKVGWKTANDFVTYVWAPKPANYSPGSEMENTVTFSAANIPKDVNDFYQFCYVSSSGQMCGASTPFQFGSSQMMSDEFEVLDSEVAGVIVGKTRSEVLEEKLAEARDENVKLEKELDFLKKDHENERIVSGELQRNLQEELTAKNKLIDELTKQNKEQKQQFDEERRKNTELLQKLVDTENELTSVKTELNEKRELEVKQPSSLCHYMENTNEQSLFNEEAVLPSTEGQVTMPSGESLSPPSESQAGKESESKLMSFAGSVLKHLRNLDLFSEDPDPAEIGVEIETSSIVETDAEKNEKISEGGASTDRREPGEGSAASIDGREPGGGSAQSCPLCNIEFPSDAELQKHIESHVGCEVCPICYVQFEKGFPWENIADHVNRHLDEQMNG